MERIEIPMILSKNGIVILGGDDEQLVQDAICTIQALADSQKFSEGFLHKAVEVAFMSEEEIAEKDKEYKARIKEKIKGLKKLIEMGALDFLNEEDEENDEGEDTFKNIFGDIL